MPDTLDIARQVAARCAVGAVMVGTSMFSLKSCVAPYSAASYEKYDAEVLYATICHDGKVTLGVPAAEWPEHKEHGDYRGPCRNRGAAGPTRAPVVDETLIAYEGNRERLKLSEEEWERQQALRLVDSTTAQRGRQRADDTPDR